MRKLFRFLLGLAACGVLLFSGVNLAAYLRESSQSSRLNENLVEEAVAVKEAVPQSDNSGSALAEETDAEQIFMEAAPIAVDFEVLLETNSDVVGWLYCEDTPINLPVVQGEDNDFYLRRMIDKTGNGSGTLFIDYRNANDFTDGNTVIYGHNMKNKSMFGTLSHYKEQSYFEEHPVMWLLTPDADYKVELVAGYVTTSTSGIFSFGLSEEDMFALVEDAVRQSTFLSDFQICQGDVFLTLSTCSYEYDNARYVVIGRLLPLQ